MTAEKIVSGLDLRGKAIVVTGGHSGIGLETTRVLSNAGASVIVGARDLQKAQGALSKLKNVIAVHLDLADPSSVDQFSEEFLGSNLALDVLVNNAGIMVTPLMRDSRGYEMEFATNHLGHFQLTARLWKALKNAQNSRVVTLSSFGHRFAGVDLDDPNFTTLALRQMRSLRTIEDRKFSFQSSLTAEVQNMAFVLLQFIQEE